MINDMIKFTILEKFNKDNKKTSLTWIQSLLENLLRLQVFEVEKVLYKLGIRRALFLYTLKYVYVF